MTQRPQDKQPRVDAKKAHPTGEDQRDSDDRSGMAGGTVLNPPQPGHESGSSGTSEYGRSDYDEPGDHEHGSNKGSGRAERDESEAKQSQLQKSSGPVSPVR